MISYAVIPIDSDETDGIRFGTHTLPYAITHEVITAFPLNTQ